VKIQLPYDHDYNVPQNPLVRSFFGPNRILSVLPKCKDNLLSTSHSWQDFNILDSFSEMTLVSLCENKIAVSSAYNKTYYHTITTIMSPKILWWDHFVKMCKLQMNYYLFKTCPQVLSHKQETISKHQWNRFGYEGFIVYQPFMTGF
jgi:hypothetical protein